METGREGFQKMEKILQAVAVLDVCVNSYCLYYVKRTFNTKQVLNHILFIDAILTVLSCLVIFFAYFMEAKCYLLSLIHFTMPTLILSYNFITAFVRYKRVLTVMTNENWKTDAELITSTNTILLATFLFLFLIFLIDTQMNFGMISSFVQCLENTTNISKRSLLLFGIRIFIVLCTIYIDSKCLRLIRSCRNHIIGPLIQFSQHEHRHILYEIPMRATIINAIHLIIMVILAPIILTSHERFKIASIAILLLLLTKTPIMILLTFRVNATTARVDQDEEREKKRQVEIEEARQKQANRLARRMKTEVETIQTLPTLPNLIHVAEAPFNVCHF